MKIRAVTRREEKQMLLAVLGDIGGESIRGWWDIVKRELAFLAITLILVAIIVVIQGTAFRFTLTIAALGFVAGVMSGVLAFRLHTTRLWPVIAKCIDRTKVESRLRELDA